MPLHQQCDGVVGADVVGNRDDLVLVEHYSLGETTQSTQPSDALAAPVRVDIRPDLGDATDALHSSDERSRDRALALVDVEVVDSGGLNGDPKLTRSGIRGVDLGEGDLLGPTVLGDDNGFQAGLPVS
jgi:hypothetical protein